MKRFMWSVFVAVTIVVVVQADYHFWYNSRGGIHTGDNISPILPDIGDEAIVQLFYAGDNGVADFDAEGMVDPFNPAGDDILMWQGRFVNTLGSSWGEDYAAGSYVYTRAPYSDDGLIFGRLWVVDRLGTSEPCGYQGHVQQMSDLNPERVPPPVPEIYNLGEDQLAGLNLFCIPEPASIGLVGVFSGLVYFAKRIFPV